MFHAWALLLFREKAARSKAHDHQFAVSITGHKTMGIFQRYQIKDTRQQAVGLEPAFAFRAAQRADTEAAA
jgi:hypothetical protein